MFEFTLKTLNTSLIISIDKNIRVQSHENCQGFFVCL